MDSVDEVDAVDRACLLSTASMSSTSSIFHFTGHSIGASRQTVRPARIVSGVPTFKMGLSPALWAEPERAFG